MKQTINTVEGNKLIAEFLGGKLVDDGWNFCLSDFGINVIGGYGFYKSFDLKFNSSWDWLMPVIYKINMKLEDYYHPNIYHDKEIELPFHIFHNNIKEAFLAVVNLIKYINTLDEEE